MPRLLVVEDQPKLLQSLERGLREEGYDVLTASDGRAAFEQASTIPVDAVILDLMLPGMSGYKVCESLREAGNAVPVLMLSARTLVEDRIRGYDVGADQYLQKPFDLEELLSMVRNLLRRKRPLAETTRASDSEYSFGRARVNFDTHEVSVDGNPVQLTATEFKLLRYFIDNEGSVVTRAQLLENVWGMTHMPTTRTVDNFIVNLRKYFEVDPGDPKHFLSIRGAGYRFVADGGVRE